MNYTTHQFEKVFKENYPMMYRIAYSMLDDAESSKDAVNEVFTEVWHKKPQINEGAERGYLLAATKNQCLHVLKKKKLWREVENDSSIFETKSQDPEHQELVSELRSIIQHHLTAQDKRVISLHYYEGMSYEETAVALGISSSSVNKHVTQSLSKIRTIFKHSKIL